MGKSTKMGPGGNMVTNNNSTNIFNMYTSGSGVGASGIASHRAKSRFASFVLVITITTTTILVYNANQGSSFVWGGVTFTRNTSLSNYSYTATTTSIPASTVSGYTYLIGVTIGNTVTNIGYHAFYGAALTSVIFTPTSTLTSIGEGAFLECSSLTSITIPNSVTSIDLSAFAVCSALTSITIPNSVTSIGTSAFQACSTLASVIFAPTSTLESIGNIAFFQCSVLTSITIPNSVTSIDISAFKLCSALASVTLPTNALFTTISDETFNGCILLTTIIIPNSVTSIGEYAFNGCSGLTTITIPNSVTSIGNNAFQNSGLTTVTISNETAYLLNAGWTSPGSVYAPDFYGVPNTVYFILPLSESS